MNRIPWHRWITFERENDLWSVFVDVEAIRDDTRSTWNRLVWRAKPAAGFNAALRPHRPVTMAQVDEAVAGWRDVLREEINAPSPLMSWLGPRVRLTADAIEYGRFGQALTADELGLRPGTLERPWESEAHRNPGGGTDGPLLG